MKRSFMFAILLILLLCAGVSGGGATCTMLLASGSPALTEDAIAKTNVLLRSAAEIKREYRALNVALMHCDFSVYMSTP